MTRHHLFLCLLACSDVTAFGLPTFAGPAMRAPCVSPAVFGPATKMCAATSGKRSPRLAVPQEVGAMVLPLTGYAGLGGVIYGASRALIPAAGIGGAAGLLAYTVGAPALLTLGQVAYFGGPGVAKAMGGVESTDPKLQRLAREAAEAVGVKAPFVYEVPSREPNAFATSGLTSKDTTVAVTTGIREVLTENELKAVLAHEMGHLKYSDVVRNMHIAAAGAGLGGLYETGRILLRSSDGGKSSSSKDDDKDESSGASLGVSLMAAGIATEAAAHLLRLSASRGAEFRADRAAAEAFGSDTIISALKKIHRAAQVRPADLRNAKASGFAPVSGSAFSHAMISDGAAANAQEEETNGFWKALDKIGNALRTHPTLEKRVAALEMATEKGLVPKALPGGGPFYHFKYEPSSDEARVKRNMGGPQ